MRELKFRVWSEEDKEYRSDIKVSDLVIDKDGVTSTIYNDEGDRFDIEQYTGLKDKNGKEIYEGDIVRGWGRNHEVKFCEMEDSDCSYFYQGWGYDNSSLYEEHDFVEVIGNIHENPELLGGEERE